MSVTDRPLTAEEYDAAAWEYYQTLPMEHFMEATPQATQREVTLVSFANLALLRDDISYFNELMVQYRRDGMLRRVVPDNMLVVGNLPDHDRSNFAIEREPVRPFMMLEWVSDSSEGKDYGESFLKYEQELRTPYCVCFHPVKGSWQVYRHDGQRYVLLESNLNGRVEVPELELEIGLHQGWIRFWYRGELLEVPAETRKRMDQLASENQEKSKHIDQLASENQEKSKHIDQLASENQEKSKHIDQLARRLDEVTERLRRLVSDRANKMGRQDILDALPQADMERLEQWLGDL